MLGLTASVGCRRSPPQYERVQSAGPVVLISLATLSDRDAHFYTYRAGNKIVNFFARTDADGVPRCHFDACYSCFKYRLGYVQQGREVICRACRIGYDLAIPVWDYVGPCVPITLHSRIEPPYLAIPAESLDKGARFF